MLLSRSTSYLPKLKNMSYNSSIKRIYSLPSMSFTCTSGKEQRRPLESGISHLSEKDVKLMLQPYYYHLSIPNDSIRSYLIRAFNYWTNLPDDIIETLDQIVIMFYESFVLTDDVNDESDYRRSRPTAHKLFGIPRAEITSKATLFIIAKKLLEINKEVAQVYVDCVLRYSLGSYKELHYRDSMICPTVEEYRQMSIDRNSSVFGLPMNIMQILAGHKTDFTKLLDLIGLYIQYLTDVANLGYGKTWDQKGFCEDISEGKYALATIHAIRSGTLEGDIISNIIRQKSKDLPTKRYCLSLMEKLGSLEFAMKARLAVENELREEINRLGGNPSLVECIDRCNSWKYDENCKTFQFISKYSS